MACVYLREPASGNTASSASSARAAWGEVYRARDTRLKRDVALKRLRALLVDTGESLARFEREAERFAALNHPNIAASTASKRSRG